MNNATKVYIDEQNGLACYVLENDWLRVAVAPQLGAKITSLRYKPQNFEVLSQPTDGTYRLPQYGDSFADYDTSGADEMFPTIDCCRCPGREEVSLPDHGELWSLPWQQKVKDGCLETTVKGVRLPYRFWRRLSLQDNRVLLHYQLSNFGGEPLPGLWAFHALVACDEQTRILLPNVSQIVNVHDSALLGAVGTRHRFPQTTAQDGSRLELDRICARSANKTEKWYIAPEERIAEAALLLNQGSVNYRLLFAPQELPYLGVWINEGGFKGEYNCALEPSDGFYDSLEIAANQGRLPQLAAGSEREWTLTIELTDA